MFTLPCEQEWNWKFRGKNAWKYQTKQWLWVRWASDSLLNFLSNHRAQLSHISGAKYLKNNHFFKLITNSLCASLCYSTSKYCNSLDICVLFCEHKTKKKKSERRSSTKNFSLIRTNDVPDIFISLFFPSFTFNSNFPSYFVDYGEKGNANNALIISIHTCLHFGTCRWGVECVCVCKYQAVMLFEKLF